jgi:hypothetical protein
MEIRFALLFCFATATRFSCDAFVIEPPHIDFTYRGMLVTRQLVEVFVSVRFFTSLQIDSMIGGRHLSITRRGARRTPLFCKTDCFWK